ncbi:MAG: LysR family transcriptional regulator [Alphaproteobacteria bacterium]|nr:LysR family transcriptional regulator [Alphaproteobacteria bacterium]
MDYLARMNIFVEVAKQESFSGAARNLGITGSAISRQIQNLEEDLQVKLLNRTTRKVSLTEEGHLLYHRARNAIESIDDACKELFDLKSTPKGLLRVTIPLSLGLQYLKTPIAQFAKKYPDVTMEVHFEDRQVNIAEEEFDLALRIGILKDSSLIARKLVDIPIHAFTSPGYLAQNTPIKTPGDLTDHNVFVYTRSPSGHVWQYQDKNGEKGAVNLQSNFRCDSVEMMKEAALAGIGIFIAPQIFVKQEIEEGKLVGILKDYKTDPERGLYAIFPPNQYIPSRTRLFIDYIHDYCVRTFVTCA